MTAGQVAGGRGFESLGGGQQGVSSLAYGVAQCRSMGIGECGKSRELGDLGTHPGSVNCFVPVIVFWRF